jgi:hypothetical protein
MPVEEFEKSNPGHKSGNSKHLIFQKLQNTAQLKAATINT